MSTNNYYKEKTYKIGARPKAILDFITKKNPKILDVGCGSGVVGGCIKKEKGGVVYGIDISSDSLEQAKLILDKTFQGDIQKIEKWPTEIFAETYDYIVISEVLEHLIFGENILKIVKKIAKPQTEIIISVPNLLFWKNRLKIFLGNFDYTSSGLMDRTHIHIFSWKSFNYMLASEGFTILEQKNTVPTRGAKRLNKFFPGLFSYQFVVKVK